jgi:hypothetical protein
MIELGIVAVWTGDAVIGRPFPIPREGLVLGHELLPETNDDRIGRRHARVEPGDGLLYITDLGSTNGTYLGGEPLGMARGAMVPLSVVLTGRTVWIVTDNVEDLRVAKVVRSVVDVIHEVDAALPIHASAIEACMLIFHRTNDVVSVFEAARTAAQMCRAEQTGRAVRFEDVSPVSDHLNCLMPRQVIAPRRPNDKP